jgi:benzoyl-CoA reductase/2-hydroxyglutaryl-CoA dehydratase subunit BcrC/BadD/HgdB
MYAVQKLREQLSHRLSDITAERQKGKKIVGYAAGGFFPEELALAAGAIPIGMVRGGDRPNVDRSAAYICRWLDTFWRGQIGAALSRDDPYLQALDLLVVPVTDNHVRAFTDHVAYFGGMNVFNFGVPHTKQSISSLDYYLNGLEKLKIKLASLTGNGITDESLLQAISVCNKERRLLRDLSQSRLPDRSPIRSKDFIELNHASFIIGKPAMIEFLSLAKDELSEACVREGPRILLTGSTLAMGDTKVLDLIEAAGGVVAIEEFAEGIKPYWEDVEEEGDLMENLARFYFWRRVPPAWFRPGAARLKELIRLCNIFDIQGIVWYHLMFRESYKTESMYYPRLIRQETGIPTLVLESDYDAAEIGQMRTRIETFMETLRK